MPIKVHYQNDPTQICSIRPTPFVSISEAVLKNKEGTFGVTYTITLTGTLLPDLGTPYALNSATDLPFGFFPGQDPVVDGGHSLVGPYNLFDNAPLSARDKPPRQQITEGINPNVIQNTKPASALLSKQRALRALFAQDGQRVEISDVLDNAGATIVCYPRTTNIDFTEGPYIRKCEYTIVLEADYLLRGNFDDDQLLVDLEGTFANSGVALRNTATTIQTLLDDYETAFIEDYSETWDIEADEGTGESVENPITYRISHTLNATGKTVYGPDGLDYNYNENPSNQLNIPAWQQAKRFALQKLSYGQGSGIGYPNIAGQIGSGTVNLVDSYGGYNHVRTESIDVTNGSYSVTENWLLSSGTANESYSMTTSTSNTDPFISVSIDGNIKGLNQLTPSGMAQGNPEFVARSGAYTNALNKYNQISNSGRFGLTSDVYKRANNLVAVTLNSQPTSISLGTNQYTGDISYNLQFNNRPVNIVSGVIAESIQVNDTYPGDVFAVIPVIGRATGPVLQYIGGRTEHKRDVSINLTMDYTKIPYGDQRSSLLMKKPSLVEPTASQIAELLGELSPQGEPGVRKYFISPPSESWNPKDGTYSFNVSWTYELDR